MVQDGCNCYFSFWAILKNEKKKKKKKKKEKKKKKKKNEKKPWRYHHFTHVYQAL